jgi:hypothetical protein
LLSPQFAINYFKIWDNFMKRNMKITFFILTMSACSIAFAKSENTEPAKQATFIVPADRIVKVTINSRLLQLKVGADFIDGYIINNSVAREMALKPSLIGGGSIIGSTTIYADSRKVPFSIWGGPQVKTRVHWFDRDITTDTDGMISANRIPYARVIFQNRPVESNDKTESLQMAKPGNWGFSGGYGVMLLDNTELRVGLSYDRSNTIVSAAVGGMLAGSHGGRFDGQVITSPVRYGVSRPMRLMQLSKPLRIASLSLNAVYVRLSEPGDGALPQDNEPKDSDEIIVTANKKGKKPQFNISIGTDDLTKCASVIFENMAKRITFNCPQI